MWRLVAVLALVSGVLVASPAQAAGEPRRPNYDLTCSMEPGPSVGPVNGYAVVVYTAHRRWYDVLEGSGNGFCSALAQDGYQTTGTAAWNSLVCVLPENGWRADVYAELNSASAYAFCQQYSEAQYGAH